MREEPRGRRQLRAILRQMVARWSEAPPFLPHRCRRTRVGYGLSVPLRCLLALVGGLVLAAAFEPVGISWLMPLGIASLVFSVRGLRPGLAWIPSLLFGITFTYAVMVWMRSVGTDAWIAMCALEASFFVPLGLGLSWSLRLRAWPVWTALWWVGIETWRSGFPFSGMPFGRLVFATADTPWADALPWIGMTGVSLLVALTGTTLAWLLLHLRDTTRTAVGRAGSAGGRDAGAHPRAVPGRRERYDDRRRGAGGRARHRARRRGRQPGGDGQPRPADPGARRGRRRRRAAAARPRRVAGELHRRGPVQRRRGERRDRRRHRRHRRAGRRRRHGQRPAGRRARPQPGHRLPPRPRQRRPLHQAPPGALRRVHPLPRQPDPRELRQAADGPARHGPRHQPRAAARRRRAGGRRDLLRRRLRRGDRRAGGTRSRAGDRADQQRDVQPHRPAGPAVRDQPAARPGDRTLGGGRRHQRHLRRRTPRRRGRGVRPRAGPGGARGDRRAEHDDHPGRTAGRVARTTRPGLPRPAHGVGAGRLSSSPTGRPHRRRRGPGRGRSKGAPRECRRPRTLRDGRSRPTTSPRTWSGSSGGSGPPSRAWT